MYAYFTSPDKSIKNSENELYFSIKKTYDLYHFLLDLPIELAKVAEAKIEMRKNKLYPSQEDLFPNTKFAENQLISKLRNNLSLNSYLEKSKLSWNNDPDLVRKLFKQLTEADFFAEYMASGERNFSDDRKLVEDIYKYLVLPSEDLEISLEEQSIYWNDDLEFCVSMILKTLKKFKEFSSDNVALMPMYKDEEDEQFTKDLFRKVILNHSEIRQHVQEHTQNWDVERIAFVDNLILEMAIAEFMYFPSIPTKVTMNEYIELSKYYSTERSRTFVNGILDKTLKDLKVANLVLKAGRGLIGEENAGEELS